MFHLEKIRFIPLMFFFAKKKEYIKNKTMSTVKNEKLTNVYMPILHA